MKELYQITGISKQALWSHKKREQDRMVLAAQVISSIRRIRKKHKRMGCRRMYYEDSEYSPVGRDLFERIGLANGFRLKRKRNVMKTTWSQRVEVYPNLIEGKVINGINQLWQSDIFYIKIEGKDHYGFCIEDVYSRKLLALHLSKSLSADNLVKALKKAILTRKGKDIRGCIFHSDRGSQYIDKEMKALIQDHNMQGSMAMLPQENAYVERLQGTLKYEYLFELELTSKNMSKQSQKALSLYNNNRPHSSLGMMTPTAFEQAVEKMDKNLRPEFKIYQWDHEFSTNSGVINKKKKKAKKKKSTTIDNK